MASSASSVTASVIAAREIRYDPGLRTHHLNHVLNHLTVPTFPFIASCDLLVKLTFDNRESETQIEIQVKDDDHRVLFTVLKEVRNVRQSGLPSGCDLSLRIPFLVEKESLVSVEVKCASDTLARYDLFVRGTSHE